MFCFLILKDTTRFHRQKKTKKKHNFISNQVYSGPVIYQIKIIARKIQQRDLEKNSFKKVLTKKHFDDT